MTQKLGASASTALAGFGVVDWTTLGVDWTTLALAVAAGIEVELSMLHKLLAQQSVIQVKTMPELLNVLQAIK